MSAEPEWNGRLCPYFARYESLPGHDPEATCAFGCHDEPACVTGAPRGGWPPLDERCDRHGLVLVIEGERRACPMCDRHEATVTVAQTLKRLYPQNPDVVLGREARTIVEALESVGLILVRRPPGSDESRST